MVTGTPSQFIINSTTPYVRPFSDDAVIVSATFLLVMFVFGLFANLVTIIVILKSKLLTSIFNFLILSLSVSDLLSALISPLLLYRRTWGFDEWLLPAFLCKIVWTVDIWSSYVTGLHILLFAITRLVYIKWPLKSKKIKLLHVKVIVAFIWFSTFLIGFIPLWIWSDARIIDRYGGTIDIIWPACTLDTKWLVEYQTYSRIAFPILIYLPIVAIAILSPTIAVVILGHRKKRLDRRRAEPMTQEKELSIWERKTRRKENNAITQLLFITGSFMLGYVPITVFMLWVTITKMLTTNAKNLHWIFGMIAYILLRLSECLNPIFYNIASGKMRLETFAFLTELCCRCTSLNTCCKKERLTASNSETNLHTRSSKENAIGNICISKRIV